MPGISCVDGIADVPCPVSDDQERVLSFVVPCPLIASLLTSCSGASDERTQDDLKSQVYGKSEKGLHWPRVNYQK